MDHFEVKVSKVQKPASLSLIQRLGFAEVCEIFVISEDLDGEWRTMEVLPPGF